MIGFAGQFAAVDANPSGRENLVLIGRLSRLGRARARRPAVELAERFGLTDAADRLVRTYSGGMRRRLDVAAALVHRPPVIFLDEPTTGLDPESRLWLWETVRELVAGGTTALLTTQYLEEADALADEVVIIDHGRVVEIGTPAALKVPVMLLLVFSSTAFVPLSTMPGWLVAVTGAHQPVTALVDAERALLLGGPAAGDVISSVAWSAGLLAGIGVLSAPPSPTAGPPDEPKEAPHGRHARETVSYPDLAGTVAVVTVGSRGIGLASPVPSATMTSRSSRSSRSSATSPRSTPSSRP